MDQMAIQAVIDSADVVITFTVGSSGTVNANTFASETPSGKALATLLREYAEVVESREK